LVFTAPFEEHVLLVRRLLRLASDNQIAVNISKIMSVLLFGVVVSKDGYRLNPLLLKAINNVPPSRSVNETRAFHGFYQQVGNFSDE
jgi:hypothetical protein